MGLTEPNLPAMWFTSAPITFTLRRRTGNGGMRTLNLIMLRPSRLRLANRLCLRSIKVDKATFWFMTSSPGYVVECAVDLKKAKRMSADEIALDAVDAALNCLEHIPDWVPQPHHSIKLVGACCKTEGYDTNGRKTDNSVSGKRHRRSGKAAANR
jgi:hypothetical protein